MKTKFQDALFRFIIRLLINYGIDSTNSHLLIIILSDLYRYTGSSDIRRIPFEAIINPGFKFTFFFRLCQKQPLTSYKKKIHAFSYYFHKKYFIKFGYQIPLKTKIGNGFQILHFGNIVLNPLCEIGINCTLAQGVLIGQNKRGAPKIGNNVWIGANASLVGDIIIGNNVLIAPGSFVNKSVPDNSLVMGNPCTIHLKTENIVDDYIVNKIKIE